MNPNITPISWPTDGGGLYSSLLAISALFARANALILSDQACIHTWRLESLDFAPTRRLMRLDMRR